MSNILFSLLIICAIIMLSLITLSVFAGDTHESTIIGRCHNGNPLTNGCNDLRYNSDLRNHSHDGIGTKMSGGLYTVCPNYP